MVAGPSAGQAAGRNSVARRAALAVFSPAATSAPDIPTDDTAVFPPGIGTSDAIVEMKMFRESSVQKLIEPPNAAMQAA